MPTLLNIVTDRIAEPARWVVVGLIAYTLATSVLYFISPPQAEPLAQDQAVSADPRPGATNINDILSRNLFGAADAIEQTIEPTATTVETRLPLELHGVFVAEVAEDSAAIVAQKGKPGTLYAIGQQLPGNAELVEVHPDHIVLRRAGTRETLTFPEVAAQLVADPQDDDGRAEQLRDLQGLKDARGSQPRPQASTSAQSPTAKRAANARDFVANYRDLIEQDPEGALTNIGVTPVSEGQSSGYRLGNLADSPYLSQTGLQPGDVVLSVNGRPVGDISQDKMEFDNVLAQGSARLEVQRGTRRFFVTASLQ